MAKFKKSNFLESFSSITKDDVTDAGVAGIVSPYSANNSQSVGLALANAKENTKYIADNISKLYKRLEYGIRIDSAKFVEDFNRFSSLVLQALSMNDIMSNDTVILKRLADILTYAYSKSNKGKFRIYSDFNVSKKATQVVFNTCKKLGLSFMSADMDDTIQKVLLSVLYRAEDKELNKHEPKKDEKPT